MEMVGQSATWAGVASYQSFHGLDSYLGSAICMGVVGRADPVVDSPGLEEGSGGVGGEFWAAIGREGVRYSKG